MALTRPYVAVADDRTVLLSIVRALAVVAGAFILASVFGRLGAGLFGFDSITAAQESASGNAAVNAVAFLGFMLAAVLFLQLRGEQSLVHLRRPGRSDLWWALIGLGGLAAGAILMGFVVDLISIVAEAVFDTPVETGQNSIIAQGRDNPRLFLYMVPVAIFVVGPAEELVFRGVVQGLFRRAFGVGPGLVGASLLFGVGHYLAISSGSAWTYILVASALGLVLGAVYEYTESIVVPALTHGFWNAGLFVLNYYVVTAGVDLPV